MGKRITSVSAGYCFTVAIDNQGQAFSWGFNDKGQLGLGHRFNQEEPRHVKALAGEFVTSLSCGSSHTVVITKRSLFSWGMGGEVISPQILCRALTTTVFGQLGHGSAKDSLLPLPVVGFERQDDNRVMSVSCGTHHSMALLEDGAVFTWGHGEYGQHGGTQDHVDWGAGALGAEGEGKGAHFHAIPRPLAGIEEAAAEVAAGSLHNCIVLRDGRCLTFGYGANGCLGHGNTRDKLIPTTIDSLRVRRGFKPGRQGGKGRGREHTEKMEKRYREKREK